MDKSVLAAALAERGGGLPAIQGDPSAWSATLSTL